MKKLSDHRTITMRLDSREFERLEHVREQLQQDTGYLVSRADVLRHFLSNVFIPGERRTG